MKVSHLPISVKKTSKNQNPGVCVKRDLSGKSSPFLLKEQKPIPAGKKLTKLYIPQDESVRNERKVLLPTVEEPSPMLKIKLISEVISANDTSNN